EWNRGKPISKNQLATLLRPFEVVPGDVWFNSKNKKGYTLKSLAPLFTRYQTARALDALPDKALRGIQNARPESILAFQTDGKPLQDNRSSGLAVQNPQNEGARVCTACDGNLGKACPTCKPRAYGIGINRK